LLLFAFSFYPALSESFNIPCTKIKNEYFTFFCRFFLVQLGIHFKTPMIIATQICQAKKASPFSLGFS